MVKMARAEMERFLAAVHVGVVSISETGRGPLTVPIWYTYHPGGLVGLVTFRDSKKARLLKVGIRFSLCVPQETPPYRFVSVEGPAVAVQDADLERQIWPLVERYLGEEGAQRYIEETYQDLQDPGELYIEMAPERWLSRPHANPHYSGSAKDGECLNDGP